jgi:manganese/zinc/iron transport system ATP- binding protein
MQSDKLISVHNLSVAYERKTALWSVDFDIPLGVICGVIGPNGSGKSTLLKTIMGLVQPVGGNVKIFDSNLKHVRSRISYVPQRESVDWEFPSSVLDVVLMGRYKPKNLLRRTTKLDKEIALNSLEKVGMLSYKDRQIGQLSGGQQQRVFLARALAQQADLYILDEPFVGIDASTEEAILAVLTELKEQGKSVIIVHHDIHTCSRYFDYIVLLNTRLVAHGWKNEVLTASNLKEAYGSQLTILSEVANELSNSASPFREKSHDDK